MHGVLGSRNEPAASICARNWSANASSANSSAASAVIEAMLSAFLDHTEGERRGDFAAAIDPMAVGVTMDQKGNEHFSLRRKRRSCPRR